MVFVTVAFEVENFDKWRKVFDGDLAEKKKGGMISETVFQDIKNKNSVTLLFEWKSPQALNAFMSTDRLKEKMEEAGTRSEPVVNVFNKK